MSRKRIAVRSLVAMALALTAGPALAQPAGQPPAGQPPAGQPPAGQPPAGQPAPTQPAPGQPQPAPTQPAPTQPQPAPGQPAQPRSAAAAPSAEASSALAVPDSPPLPPQPGAAPGTTPPPPALPKVFADEAALSVRSGSGEPVAGWHGVFFIRDPDGNFRISPVGFLQLDFNSSFGDGVDSVPTAAGGAGMPPRFYVKKARFGFAGDFLKRWSFQMNFDLANGALSNENGTDEAFAAPAGTDPTADTARFRPPQGVDAGLAIRDVWVNYALGPFLNFQFGQFRQPFGQENRTSDTMLPLMDRSIATRGFVVPGGREMGLMVWGDIGDDVFTYEVMVDGGEGEGRPPVDATPDFAGRFLVKPFGSIKLIKDVRFGISGRHGERDPESVAYNITSTASQQGYVFFGSTYKDSAGRRTNIIPSGGQNVIGGEVMFPVGPVDIAGEAYYAAYHTREAVDGYQLTNTERLGTMSGVGLTTWVTWWALGDAHIGGEAGRQKPGKLNLKKKPKYDRGLEITALVSAILADYDGASRGGEYDAKTPGSADKPTTAIDLIQMSLAASYWHTKNVRLSLNYGLYFAPGAGTDNLAVVPGNIVKEADPEATMLHELGTRIQLAF